MQIKNGVTNYGFISEGDEFDIDLETLPGNNKRKKGIES